MRHQAPIPTFFTRLLCQLTPTAVCVPFWQGPFQTPPLLPGLTERSGSCLPEKKKGNKLVLFGFCVLYLSLFLTKFPITLLQSSGKLLEAYLVVHLVNGQYGAGDGFHFRIFIFLMFARKEKENDGLKDRRYLREHEPGARSCFGSPVPRFFGGMGVLESVFLMRLWLPFQR